MNRSGLGKVARQPGRKKLEREVERLQEAFANAERDADSWEAEVDRWYDLVPPQISRADIHGAIELQMRFVAEYERLQARFTLPVVCICGSTRFADEHAIARWELEQTGKYICLMINYLPDWFVEQQKWDGHEHFGEAAGVKHELDELHKRKIDLADWVLVIAPQAYIGESTRSEIDYAMSQGKSVQYAECGVDARNAAEAAGEKNDG